MEFFIPHTRVPRSSSNVDKNMCVFEKKNTRKYKHTNQHRHRFVYEKCLENNKIFIKKKSLFLTSGQA